MADPLRPLSTRQLLIRTFRLYRQNSNLFIGVSIIGPATLLMYLLLRVHGPLAPVRPQSAVASMVVAILIGVTIMVVGLTISLAATVKTVAALHLGRQMRLSEAYRACKGSFGRRTGILISVFIRAFLGGVLFIFAGMFALGLAAALGYNSRVEAGRIGFVCGGIALVAAILASIGIYVRFSLAVPACVVENIGRTLALRRSAFLTEGARGRVAAVFSVFMILSFVMNFVIGESTMLLRGHGIALQIANAAAGFIAAALIAPVGTISMSLVYYDERVRKEAFDLQPAMAVLAEHAGATQIGSR